MNLRDFLRTARWIVPALLVLTLAVACGSGDEDDATATASGSGATSEATGTSDDADDMTTGTAEDGMTTGTAEDDATGTADDDMTTGTAEEDDATGTADDDTTTGTAEEDDATGTADDDTTTGTAEDDATGTAGDDMTTGTADDSGAVDPDDPFANLGDVTELENYTLSATGTFNFTASGPQDFTMEVQQSALDNYHFTVDIADLTTMAVWVVTDAMYVQVDGGATEELPFSQEEAMGQFNPGFYLTQVQQGELFSTAELVEEEEINGRATTHYTFTAEQWAEAAMAQGIEVEEVSGEGGDIWVDNELNVIVRADIDVNWTDAASGGSFEQVLTWEVSAIDETDPVEPPSS